MARKPKPSIPRRQTRHEPGSWLGRWRLLALKNMLGIGLTPEEAWLGPMPRVGVFTAWDVAQVMADPECSRWPLGLSEALAKLGLADDGSLS